MENNEQLNDFMVEALLDFEMSRRPSNRPTRENLSAIGTIVGSNMSGRAIGRITGYNQSTGPFYGNDRYPYIIKWEDGYEDCYGIDGELVWLMDD